jgi:hypothetical protein
MGTTDIIRRIERELGMFETSQVRTFEGIRETADGSILEITVELLDAGKGAGARRYAAPGTILDALAVGCALGLVIEEAQEAKALPRALHLEKEAVRPRANRPSRFLHRLPPPKSSQPCSPYLSA